jgi:hypothetical protein
MQITPITYTPVSPIRQVPRVTYPKAADPEAAPARTQAARPPGLGLLLDIKA